MMPPLTTPVLAPRLPFQIDFATGILSIGSCFADEIARRLQMSDFHILANPFGTLYNPASIAAALQRLIDDRPIGPDDLVLHDGLFHSWHHHGSFSRPTPDETLLACNTSLHQAHLALRQADLLILTFGTAWVFEHLQSKAVVANCHKLPPATFSRRRMSVDEIVALWQPLLLNLHTLLPHLHILFSVSPIRHLADGAHDNQLSKSTLLLAVDQLISQNTKLNTLSYFPAYEIVLDELRDYRFFDHKMSHPTDLAIDIVWERFQRASMAPAIQQQTHFNAKQHLREQHIPLH